MSRDLTRLFNPRSIAIVGASQDVKTISGQPLNHMINTGYPGRPYPVNPRYEQLLGHRCYPSVLELPETPDLALIAIGAARVPAALRQCGEKGIPFAIILSSGFSELGEQGRILQRELVDIAGEFNIGVVGPNCQGMISVVNNVRAGFGSVFGAEYQAGSISMVSQSGGFGYSVMTLAAKQEGLAHRHVITTGNEIGISTLDIMEYLVADPGTTLITGYTEGMKDARRLIEVGDQALAAGKPILIWKVGNSEAGQKAAASHTANLGGAMALYRSAFRQTGIIQVEDMQDIFDWAHAFGYGKVPRGNRVAMITVSGGAGILMTDECIAWGLQVPQLSADSIAKLRKVVPAFASLVNPIDVTAAIFDDPNLVRNALTIVIEDPNVDCVALINAGIQGDMAVALAREIVAVNAVSDKPIFCAWSARKEVAKEAYAIIDAARIPHYQSPMRTARAIAVLCRYAADRRQRVQRIDEQPLRIESPQARKQLAGRTTDIAEYEAKAILRLYGIAVTQEALATTRDEALDHAARIGYPVALKVQSADLSHKTEAKAVRLGIASPKELSVAYDEILTNARAYRADARIDGVLVQEMVSGGVECILGITNDPLFGPAVMFGLGGIFAEVMKDVAFRVAPVTRSAALDMIREIKGYPVLDGARGRPVCDVAALADAIVRLSALAVDLEQTVAELDINPLFVFAAGDGVKAADALIRPRLVTT